MVANIVMHVLKEGAHSMAKEIAYDNETREKLATGVAKLADAVRVTIGPKGRYVGITKKGERHPNVSNDGATVAAHVGAYDHVEKMGLQVVREAATAANNEAGDGTSTATLLADAIVREGVRYVTAGNDPLALRRGIQKAADVASDELLKAATQVTTREQMAEIATVSSGDSEIGGTIAYLSDLVAEDESMNMEVSIYPSGVLGSETAMVELVQAGVLDMAKISANTLGQFDDRYTIFSLPYLFKGQEHYYNAMANSQVIRELFNATEDAGYIAIGYYCNGARNFYLKDDVAVTSPAVLKGKKIRSMVSSTSMDMIEAMGGSPVPMSASETYTSLQQGIVDGAENTELALTVDKHEEIVKSYTYTEHQYTPDIYIISTKVWNKLSKEQQDYLLECFSKLNDNFVQKYNQMMDDAITEAESYGVHVYRDIDKTPFIEAVQPIHQNFLAKGDAYQRLYDDIQSYAEDTSK